MRRTRVFICLLVLSPNVGSLFADDHLVRFAPAAQYTHRTVRFTEIGSGPRSYCLFEPYEPRCTEPAPVVVFLHGWMGVNPAVYGAWIEHLCRRGAIVIFPRYQDDFGTPPEEFLPNAAAAIRDALDALETRDGATRPDKSRLAFIGHSAGGNLAALLAASGRQFDLPEPGCVAAIMPGEVAHQETPHLADIPESTLLLVVAGDRDIVVGDQRARDIFEGATAIPRHNKKFVFYRSDTRGPVAIIADHLAPTGANPRFDNGQGPFRAAQIGSARVDLIDRYALWRAADLTMLAAFSGQSLDEASDRGALFADLGRFSDGRVVLPPICGDDLSQIPRVALPHGARMTPAPSTSFRPFARNATEQASPKRGGDR